MKIIFVISALRNGGADRVLQILANGICDEFDVKIAYFEEDQGRYKFDKRVQIEHVNVYKKQTPLYKFRTLRRYFREENPALIISLIDWTNVACIIANLGLKSKIIATEHNEQSFLSSKIYRFLRDFSYKFCDVLTVLSRSDFEYYSKFTRRCEIMHNPFFGDLRANFYKENTILCVARLESVKNHKLILDALNLIPQVLRKEWKIIFVGDGSLRKELIEYALNLDVSVEFVGHKENVREYYENAKIFVLGSNSEGLSNVLIESAFYECARVCTATIGAMELIKDGKTGLLSPIKDEKALAKNLEILMSDKQKREQIIQNAKANLSEFEPKNIIKKWKNLINSLF